jgi:hypothetical protein
MAKALPLPDGTTVAIREGETPAQTWARAQQMYPEAFGLEKEEAPVKKGGSGLGDLARAFGSGALGATGALASVFGADNAASRNLSEASKSLQEGLSDKRKAELQMQAERMKQAEASGSTLQEIKAGLLNVAEAPLQTAASALGSFVPVLATLPLAKIGLGARAITALRGAISAAQGAGSAKQSAYEAVLQAETEEGKSPEQAQAAAIRAQNYVGENIDQILLGAGLGYVAGTRGVEKLLPGGVRPQAGAVQQALAKRIGERAATGVTAAAAEMPLEGTQGAQERVAANLALQRTGRDVDTFTGAAGQFTQEALAGGLGGGALGAALPDRSLSLAAAQERKDKQAAAKEAAEQERIAAEKEAAEKQTPKYALQIANQLKTLEQEKLDLQKQVRSVSKDSLTEAEDKAHNKEIQAQLKKNAAERDALAPEKNRLIQSGIYQQALEQERVAGLTPQEYALEQTKTVSNKPAKFAEPDLEGYYDPQIIVPSEERQKAQEAERARVAAVPAAYAAERMELARSQTYDPTGQDYVEYLLQDPYKAGLLIETRTPLPGLSSSESNLIIKEVAKRLKAMGKEELAARQAELQAQTVGKPSADPMAAFMEQSDTLDVDRRQGVTDSDIAFTERQAAMPREVIQQGDLFGEQRVGQAAGVQDTRGVDQQLSDLQRQLEIAYAQRNVQGGAQYRETIRDLTEKIRDLQSRAAEPTIGALGGNTDAVRAYIAAGTPDRKPDESIEDWYARTEKVTPTTSGLPESLEAKRAAEAERQAALTRVADKEEGAQDAVAASLVNEILSARRDLRPETLTEIEQEVRSELGVLERYGANPQVLSYVNARLDALSQKWRGGMERGETFTKAPTPKTTSEDMLREQMDRAFAQRERYDADTLSVLEQLADNLKAFSASPERRDMVGEWLNRVTQTGRSSPEMTADVRSELARLEEGKLQESGQQELPERFLPKTVRGAAPTTVEGGKATFGAPGAMQAPAKKSTAFATAAEFQKYLASDALKVMRQALGMGKDTASRTHARIELFRKKVENITKQLAAFEERKKSLQALRGVESNTARDLLNTAEANLKKIYDRLDTELAELQADYIQARQQFDFTAQTVEDVGQKIADNLAQFQSTDAAVVSSAQETADAKSAFAAAVDKPVTKQNFSALRTARRGIITAIEKQITASRKAGADDTILAFLNADLNLQMQLQAEEKVLDQDAQSLLNAGLALEEAAATQKRSRKNQKEIKQAQQELAAALDIKGAIDKEAGNLDAQIAKVESDIAAAEKQLNRTQQTLQRQETKQEDTLATTMESIKIDPLSKAERDAKTAEDKAKLETFQKSTAALAALPGERIDFSKRQEMLALLRVSNKDSDQLDANIKDIEAGIEEMQIQVAVAEEQLVGETSPDRVAALNKKVKDGNERVAALKASLGNYEKAKARKLAAENKARVLLSGDPEVTQDIDKRIDKLVANIKNQEELAKQTVSPKTKKPLSAETIKDRAKTLARYKRELQVLTGVRSNRLGIKRIDVTTGAATKDLRTDKKTGQTTVKGKKASVAEQEQFDAEVERVQAYGFATDRLSAMEQQLAAMKAAKEPRGKAKQEERAEKIRDLQEKVNTQQAEVDRLAPKTVGAVSQATKTESSAPAKLRAGTAETKADKGVSRRPIVETRTAKPITATTAVADANAFAERLIAAKTPTDLADEFADQDVKTRAAVLAAVDSNVSMYRSQIATLESERDALQASVDLAKDPLRIPVVTRDRLATIREELGIKQRLLAKAEGTKAQAEMMEYTSLRAPTIEGGTGVSGFDIGISDALEDFEFSRGAPADGGQTVEALEKALDKVVGDPGVAGKRIKLFQSVSDLFNDPAYKYDYDGADIPADAKAFVNPKNGQVFMFADNIGKGEALGVLLHEVGVHIGFRNLFNKAQYARLVSAVKGWANRNDNSLESKIAKRAVARVEAAETTADQYDDELLAYAVEEAIKAGVNPDALQNGSPIRNWLKAVMDVLRNALSKYGINVKTLTTGDLVNMAYGAAQLELRGTWHGSDAAFTAFNTKYAGAGEGAFDLRFEAEESLGVGPYTTPNKEYAEYYQHAVPFGKAANDSGYGSKTYQDYRAMDEKFMTTSNEDLSTAALQSKFESRLVTAYLEGVSAGQSLDPTKNKNAQEMLNRLQTGARTPKEEKAAATLSLQKIKALKEYPAKGNLYRTLDDIPRSRIYSVNSDFKVGERPALDALLEKYGSDWVKRTAKDKGSYPANTVFFSMRKKVGIKKATELLKAAGIDAIEQNNERGKYVERAYIDQAPEILAINLKPAGPATGKGRPGTGTLLFSRGAPADALEALSKKIIAQPKTLREKAGSNLALQTEMQAVDSRAGLRETLKFGDDSLFTQAMYHVRKAEQKMAQMFTVMNSGPLVAYKDEKGLVGYRSSNQNSAREVFDAIADVPIADPQLKTDVTQAYLVAVRANNKGLAKLDLGAMKLEQAELDAALAAADANPALKSALENVRRKYSAYNKGMIEFLASTGRISKKEAADLLKDGDFVPFYRVDKNGNADLVFNNNVTFNVGDIRRQPYLAELKGGETKLLPLNEAIQRNTLLLTDMALTNNAAKSVAYGLQALGKGAGPVDPKTGKPTNLMAIKKGFGTDDAKVVRFYQEPDPNDPKDDGKRHIVVDTKGTLAEGIPAELVVQSLEGASLALPGFFKLGGAAADLLRAGVTRTPLYIARKLVREPMAAAFTGGLNTNAFSAVFKAGAEFLRMSTGSSDMQAKLIEKGLIQSNIFAGDMSDMKKMALQIASGKDQGALEKVFAAADRYAMRADAATLALVLKNAEANGLSEVEADMMTMESMNFYKRGLSPTLQYAARLIPFFNAQIQGLNVLVKAARGNMPFEEQQQIKRKFYNNALLLTATGLIYAMAMEDDEYFRNARPRDKYSNFFLPIPGVDEPLKMPIPFEAGYFFSLAVAAVDSMRAETDGKAQWQAIRDLFLGSIPGYSSMGIPQLAKPVLEVWTNKNFLTGAPVESLRLQGMNTEERYLATTTELAKQMSKAVPILSPIQIEHIVRGYLGVLPLAAAAGANGLFEREGKGEKPEGRASDLPLVGSAFQKKYGGGDSDVVFREAKEAEQTRNTLNKMIKEGRREEAVEFRDANRVDLALASVAGQYRQVVGRINEDIRRTQERTDLNAKEKSVRLEALEKAKQDRADAFLKAKRTIEDRVQGGRT